MLIKQQMTMQDMQEYVIRYIISDNFSNLECNQVEQCLRNIYTLILDRSQQGSQSLKFLEQIPLDTVNPVNKGILKKLEAKIEKLNLTAIQQYKQRAEVNLKSSQRPFSGVHKGRPQSAVQRIITAPNSTRLVNNDFRQIIPEVPESPGMVQSARIQTFDFDVQTNQTITTAQRKVK